MNDAITMALAAGAELTARVLREHPDLPRIVGITLRRTLTDHTEVWLQSDVQHSVGEAVTTVTDWAYALDCTVTLTVHERFTQVAAEAVIDGHRVLVWNHLNPVDTAEVFARLGLPEPTLGTHIDISPTALLRTVTPAVAVA